MSHNSNLCLCLRIVEISLDAHKLRLISIPILKWNTMNEFKSLWPRFFQTTVRAFWRSTYCKIVFFHYDYLPSSRCSFCALRKWRYKNKRIFEMSHFYNCLLRADAQCPQINRFAPDMYRSAGCRTIDALFTVYRSTSEHSHPILRKTQITQ